MRDIDIEKLNAKLFIFFLPFRMPAALKIIRQFIGMPAEFFSLVFHLIGLLFMALRGYKDKASFNASHNRLLNFFVGMISYFAVVSLFMATYVFMEYGNYNGNSPYTATIKMIVDFIQYLFILVYCRRVFVILGVESVLNCLTLSSRVVMVVGYLQISKIYGLPVFSVVSDGVSDFLALNKFNNQIALTLYEPSWAAIYIGVIVLPMLLARLYKKDYSVLVTVLEIALWVPIIVMTKSTTAFLLMFATFAVAIIGLLFNRNVKVFVKIFAVFLFACGVLIINTDIVDKIVGFDFSYLLREKLFDNSNQSTAMRKLPLIGDWEIFKRFPILGCGNGLQGYFYPMLIPTEYLKSVSLDDAGRALVYGTASTIPNGQLFFPGILSGYGIIGAFIFILFLLKSFSFLKENHDRFGQFEYMYKLSLLSVLLAGIKSEFVGFYIVWFVLAIPYAAYNCDEIRDKEYE